MGKDNITFHSQIWPAELLAYDGQGERGGAPGTLGTLNLPTEVVSSEFLTMSGSKFSTSRKTVIYVGDFLREFGPDALRYFIAAAGPENQDADFTWEEFVRRTNFELANEWGNLVNRSISMAHKNFGQIPHARSTYRPGRRTAQGLRAGLRHGRRPVGPQPVQGSLGRGDAGRGSGQQVHLRVRAVEARATIRNGRRPCCTPRCRWSTTPRPC